MKKQDMTREHLDSAVATLESSERGRQTLRDLLALIINGADGLDSVNQTAVHVILACQFGPFAGSTREQIKRAVGMPKDESPFSDQEIATVLAALRMWQFHHADKKTTGEIPSIFRGHFDDHMPLRGNQIDELCERLNLVGA